MTGKVFPMINMYVVKEVGTKLLIMHHFNFLHAF